MPDIQGAKAAQGWAAATFEALATFPQLRLERLVALRAMGAAPEFVPTILRTAHDLPDAVWDAVAAGLADMGSDFRYVLALTTRKPGNLEVAFIIAQLLAKHVPPSERIVYRNALAWHAVWEDDIDAATQRLREFLGRSPEEIMHHAALRNWLCPVNHFSDKPALVRGRELTSARLHGLSAEAQGRFVDAFARAVDPSMSEAVRLSMLEHMPPSVTNAKVFGSMVRGLLPSMHRRGKDWQRRDEEFDAQVMETLPEVLRMASQFEAQVPPEKQDDVWSNLVKLVKHCRGRSLALAWIQMIVDHGDDPHLAGFVCAFLQQSPTMLPTEYRELPRALQLWSKVSAQDKATWVGAVDEFLGTELRGNLDLLRAFGSKLEPHSLAQAQILACVREQPNVLQLAKKLNGKVAQMHIEDRAPWMGTLAEMVAMVADTRDVAWPPLLRCPRDELEELREMMGTYHQQTQRVPTHILNDLVATPRASRQHHLEALMRPVRVATEGAAEHAVYLNVDLENVGRDGDPARVTAALRRLQVPAVLDAEGEAALADVRHLLRSGMRMWGRPGRGLRSRKRNGQREIDNAWRNFAGKKIEGDYSKSILETPEMACLVAYVWKRINQYINPENPEHTPKDRINMRQDFIRALAEGIEHDLHRVCDTGRKARLVRVLQGYVAEAQLDLGTTPHAPFLLELAKEYRTTQLSDAELAQVMQQRGKDYYAHDPSEYGQFDEGLQSYFRNSFDPLPHSVRMQLEWPAA